MTFVNPLSEGSAFDINKPVTFKKMVRAADGTLQVQTIDPSTGQVVNNPADYNTSTSQIMGLDDLGLSPTKEDQTDKQDLTTETEEEYKYQGPGQNTGASDTGGFTNSGSGMARSESNNYGYIDKPGWVGATSALPSGFGLMGKALNAAINANNASAVNAARDTIDVDPLSTKDFAKGVMKDRQGFVGNVDITNALGDVNSYSVGLEAMTPSGKTTLTPDEARKRAAANPDNIKLSEDQDENKKSGFGSKIRDFLDNLFSDDETDNYPDAPSMGSSEGEGFSGSGEESYDGTSYSGENQGYDTPSETGGSRFGGDGLGGLSDTAKGDVDKGEGGLY